MKNIISILNESHSYTKKSNIKLYSKYIYQKPTLVYEKVFVKGQSDNERIFVTNDKLYKKINDFSERVILLKKDDKLDIDNKDTILEMNLVNTSILSINTEIPVTTRNLNEVLSKILLDDEKVILDIFINGINKTWIRSRLHDYKMLKENQVSDSRRHCVLEYYKYAIKNIISYSNPFYKRYINKSLHSTNIEFIDKNSKQKHKALLFDTDIRFIIKGLNKERNQEINKIIKDHISILDADNRFTLKEEKVYTVSHGENQKEYLDRVKDRVKFYHLGDLNALTIKEIQSLIRVI